MNRMDNGQSWWIYRGVPWSDKRQISSYNVATRSWIVLKIAQRDWILASKSRTSTNSKCQILELLGNMMMCIDFLHDYVEGPIEYYVGNIVCTCCNLRSLSYLLCTLVKFMVLKIRFNNLSWITCNMDKYCTCLRFNDIDSA